MKKAATDQKYVEMDQKEWGNRPEKKRKPFNYKYWETDTKYSEIPQQFWAFEGIPWNSSKVNLIRFRVARFPCYQQFLYLKSISDFQPTVSFNFFFLQWQVRTSLLDATFSQLSQLTQDMNLSINLPQMLMGELWRTTWMFLVLRF